MTTRVPMQGVPNASWSLRDVRYAHPAATQHAVDGVSLEIARGRITALLGPNGAGKSTLLDLMLGVIAPSSGTILFGNRSLAELSRAEFAREVGVVPQGESEPLYTVREVISMGRYPHLGRWQRQREHDIAAIERAMSRCSVAELSSRWFTTLSGGERQRVRLARALAQEPSILVLDEPTASLDIRYEMATFELLRSLREEGKTIVLVTHNLNLAARYADELVLLRHGRVVSCGTPGVVLTARRVSEVYEWPTAISMHEGSPQIVPRALEAALVSSGCTEQ